MKNPWAWTVVKVLMMKVGGRLGGEGDGGKSGTTLIA